MRKIFLTSLVYALPLAIVSYLLLIFAMGPHPECSVNSQDVGPCDYWGRVWFTAFVVVYAIILYYLIILGARLLLHARRRKASREKP